MRSSDLIVCVSKYVTSIRNESRVTNRTRSVAERSEAAGVGPKGRYEPNRTGHEFSTVLILNDQIRSNGVRSSDLILNDQ